MALDLELRLATARTARPARAVPPALGPLRPARAARSPRRTSATPPRRSRGRRFDRLLRPLRPRHRRAAAARAAGGAPGWRSPARARVGRERQAARRPRRRARAAGRAPGPASRCTRSALLVRNVVPDSPAWRARLTFGDDIVAVDGARVTAGDVREARRRPRSRRRACRITYFRRDLLRGDDADAGAAARSGPGRSRADARARARAAAVRAGWLGQARRR